MKSGKKYVFEIIEPSSEDEWVRPKKKRKISSNRRSTKKPKKRVRLKDLLVREEVRELTDWKVCSEYENDETCAICLFELSDGDEGEPISICNGLHKFHDKCLIKCYNNREKYLECPYCKTIYGVRIGNMPTGTMNVRTMNCKLGGYPDCDTICITYNFPDGIQGPEHQTPGKPYFGTSRVCYLPNNDEGNLVLRMLKIAFDRRLSFQIGTSLTTGASGSVIWNGIHHKTTTAPGNFGFPDPEYLLRVTGELIDKGVFPDDARKLKDFPEISTQRVNFYYPPQN